jgi:hypothetical protein
MQSMMLGVAILVLYPQGTAQIQLRIALIGKAHAAMELNSSITGK